MKQTTPWCNGSTTGFGPVSLGSNPGGVAIFLPRWQKNNEATRLLFTVPKEQLHSKVADFSSLLHQTSAAPANKKSGHTLHAKKNTHKLLSASWVRFQKHFERILSSTCHINPFSTL